MGLDLRSVTVRTGGDAEGLLVFRNEALVAVLVKLSETHGENAGRWYLEAGFGELAVPLNPVFGSLDAAQAWIDDRLTDA